MLVDIALISFVSFVNKKAIFRILYLFRNANWQNAPKSAQVLLIRKRYSINTIRLYEMLVDEMFPKV